MEQLESVVAGADELADVADDRAEGAFWDHDPDEDLIAGVHDAIDCLRLTLCGLCKQLDLHRQG
jgi:hypothetical protein